MKNILLTLLILSTHWVEAKDLRFRPYTKVTGQEKVKLKDIIENFDAKDEILNKIGSVVIGDTPQLGEQRIYSSRFISSIVRKHGHGKLSSVKIPNRIIVANKGREINAASVEKQLISAWKKSCEACRIRIRNLNLPSVTEHLSGRPWRLDISSRRPRGSFTERMYVTGVDNRENTFWINGQVEFLKKVPVATRSLSSQTRISESDFRMEWRDITFANDTTHPAKDLLNLTIKFGVPANQVIWSNSVAKQKAVQRGDLVKVTSGEGDWQVSMQAVTEQSGYVGDRINLRNVRTKKVISGEIVGPGQVVLR